jgi:hypothetical protein
MIPAIGLLGLGAPGEPSEADDLMLTAAAR